ncbi:MAG: hypothetical protein H6544_05380 [Prevotellaceae bacterium]|nr:hypothetical protein [Prevotellaceae bacterium]
MNTMRQFLCIFLLFFLFSSNSFSEEFNWGVNFSALYTLPNIDFQSRNEVEADPQIGGSAGFVAEMLLGKSVSWSVESGVLLDFVRFSMKGRNNGKKQNHTLTAISVPVIIKRLFPLDKNRSISFGLGGNFLHFNEDEVCDIVLKKNSVSPLADIDFSFYDFRISAAYELGVMDLMDENASKNKIYRNARFKTSNIRLGITWFFL